MRLDLAAEYPDDHLICNGEKRCSRCEQVRSLDGFPKGGGGGIGCCRECCNLDSIKSYRKKYWKDEAFRQSEKERVKAYRCLGPKTGTKRTRYPKQEPLIRTCRDCQLTKPIVEFMKGKGRYNRCRECLKVASRARFTEKYRTDEQFRERQKAKALAYWRKKNQKAA